MFHLHRNDNFVTGWLRLRRCNATRGNLCEKSSTVHLLESDRMGDHEKSRLDDPKVTPYRLPDPFRFCFFRVEDLTEAIVISSNRSINFCFWESHCSEARPFLDSGADESQLCF